MILDPISSAREIRPTPFGNWWLSDQGQRAHAYLEAWASVERERLLSGDPSALPSPEGPCGGRSGPSNMPDVALKHMDVERLLSGKPELRRLVAFIWRDGMNWRESEDGIVTTHYDLLRLERYEVQPEMASVCRLYGVSPAWLLMQVASRFGRTLARELGL